jgi:hypothetical protein
MQNRTQADIDDAARRTRVGVCLGLLCDDSISRTSLISVCLAHSTGRSPASDVRCEFVLATLSDLKIRLGFISHDLHFVLN